MDETPLLENSKQVKTHHRHTSITTIADNVNNEDRTSISSKRSNSAHSVTSIEVLPKSPDTLQTNNVIVLDKNSNEVTNNQPVKKTYPNEVPRSKVRHHKPHVPIETKPRPLTQSYKYFSGPPPKYRDYKYRDYKAKNTDIPKYNEYKKYREYNKYREYKLTHWNTFWLGGYKENVPKPVPKKPKPVGRPKKPVKKIGILSAHSLFYPYSEFKYRPYEKIREYKYRDYNGYREYNKYREYKGRQVPLSTLYNFIGIWRPLGSKTPVTWSKSKLYDPPSKSFLPPSEDTKVYDPPVRQLYEESEQAAQPWKTFDPPKKSVDAPDGSIIEDVKLYDPPQKTIMLLQNDAVPHNKVHSEPSMQEDFKLYSPPQRQFVLIPTANNSGNSYIQENKNYEPPSRQTLPPVVPIVADNVGVVKSAPVMNPISPTETYQEELKIYEPPSKAIDQPAEYTGETKVLDPLQQQLTPPNDYKEEFKDYNPPERHLLPPKEYIEETKLYDPVSVEVIPPREYKGENKEYHPPTRRLAPPKVHTEKIDEEKSFTQGAGNVAEATEEQVQEPTDALPLIVPQHERGLQSSYPIDNYKAEYEGDMKVFEPSKRTIEPENENLSTLNLREHKVAPLENTNQDETIDCEVENKTYNLIQRSMSPPMSPQVEENSTAINEDILEYVGETKLFSPRVEEKTLPLATTKVAPRPQTLPIEVEDKTPLIEQETPVAASAYPSVLEPTEENRFNSEEKYVGDTKVFDPKSQEKSPPEVIPDTQVVTAELETVQALHKSENKIEDPDHEDGQKSSDQKELFYVNGKDTPSIKNEDTYEAETKSVTMVKSEKLISDTSSENNETIAKLEDNTELDDRQDDLEEAQPAPSVTDNLLSSDEPNSDHITQVDGRWSETEYLSQITRHTTPPVSDNLSGKGDSKLDDQVENADSLSNSEVLMDINTSASEHGSKPDQPQTNDTGLNKNSQKSDSGQTSPITRATDIDEEVGLQESNADIETRIDRDTPVANQPIPENIPQILGSNDHAEKTEPQRTEMGSNHDLHAANGDKTTQNIELDQQVPENVPRIADKEKELSPVLKARQSDSDSQNENSITTRNQVNQEDNSNAELNHTGQQLNLPLKVQNGDTLEKQSGEIPLRESPVVDIASSTQSANSSNNAFTGVSLPTESVSLSPEPNPKEAWPRKLEDDQQVDAGDSAPAHLHNVSRPASEPASESFIIHPGISDKKKTTSRTSTPEPLPLSHDTVTNSASPDQNVSLVTPTKLNTQMEVKAARSSMHVPAVRPNIDISDGPRVEDQDAVASSGFPTLKSNSQHDRPSARAEILEPRLEQPVWDMDDNRIRDSLENKTPGGPGGAALGSIRRTMRLLGK